MILKVKKLDDRAIVPQRVTSGSAGYDLCSLETVTFKRYGTPVLVHTGVSIEVDSAEPVAIKLYIRSGMGKKGFILSNGVGLIDQDYRGELCALIQYFGDKESATINAGDRIAQIVIEPVYLPDVEVVNNLSNTSRGSNGFGSTGI